jgi:hypothetical protein
MTGDQLSQLTQAFWKVSAIREGKYPQRLSIAGAIKILQEILSVVSPNHPLARSTNLLLNDIIEDKPRTSTSKSGV